MPSTSAKQRRFMEAVANNSAFAKKAGVPQSVGKDFSAADRGKRFAGGGASKQKINIQNTRHGAMDMPFKSLRRFAGMKVGGDIPIGYRKGKEMKEKMMKGSNMPKMESRMAAMRRPTQVSAAMPGMSSMMKKGGMAHGGMHKMPDGKMMKNSAMNMGGMAGMKSGGMPMKDGKPAFMQKKMNMGGMAKYAAGGSVGSASRRADGIAQRGKTKAKMV